MQEKFCSTRKKQVKTMDPKHTGSNNPEALKSYSGRWRVGMAEGPVSPGLFNRHLGLANLFGLKDHIIFAQAVGGDPRGIPLAAHLANLVRVAL
jgi:hypothetical protein